jgi:hypothetical protein
LTLGWHQKEKYTLWGEQFLDGFVEILKRSTTVYKICSHYVIELQVMICMFGPIEVEHRPTITLYHILQGIDLGVLEDFVLVISHQYTGYLGMLCQVNSRYAYTSAEFKHLLSSKSFTLVVMQVPSQRNSSLPKVESIVAVREDEHVIDGDVGLGRDEYV